MDERTTTADLEIRLEQVEARHRLLTASWAQAEWETDAAGFVVADSPSWRAYTGQTLEEWLGYGWLDAVHPDDRAFAGRQWREAIAARGLVNAEFRLRAPDGSWRWTNVRAAPMLDAGGTVQKWAGINIDIDARKRAEAALRESEQRFRALVTAGGNSIYRMSPDWRLMYQLDSDTLVPTAAPVKDWVEKYIPPDDLPAVRAAIDHAIRTKSLFELEHRVWVADGGIGWVISRAVPLLGEDGQITEWFGAGTVVTERKRAEQALRESEKRYRALFESMDEAYAVVDVLKDQAGAWTDFRFVEVNPAFIAHTSMPWPVGKTATELLGEPNPRWTELYGQTLDTGEAIRAEEDEPTLDRVFDLNIFTLDRERNRVAVLFANITARKRTETALRDSEERFQQFAKASAAALWIRNAGTLALEYISPAVSDIYGVESDAFLGDVKRWAAVILPEDRDTALDYLKQAKAGAAVVNEFRIQRPSDQAFCWIRSTVFPLRENNDIPRIGGICEDVTEAKLASQHTSVLLAELQHRVRNIMALLRSITNRTGERAESVPEYRDLMMGRLLAFARVQALLTRTANVNVGIASIMHDELSVQAQHERQYVLDGPDVTLSPKAAEVLTLAVHELATNAVKYGALSVPTGQVTVRWSTFEKRGGSWLSFDWLEEGAPPRVAPDAPHRRGFGSELIEERIPYELRGRGQVTIEPEGARCHLEFPLQGGASILETGAPLRRSIFGGAIDMTGEPDLTGRRVLVVEDDYYLATDSARALRGAGAEVIGPCATEEDARAELGEQRPDAVVVDINLGPGPSFKLAETLRDDGIPFVFTTGYDPEVIPAEFNDVERLEKPFQLRQIVGAVARLTCAAA